jgi:O-antigen/teichoic acid export membrane protein
MTASPRLSLLARNTVVNLAGQAAPLAAAIVAIPFLVKVLGAERFGMLSLAWVLVGYFGLFDLGLGRALTHALAQRGGASKPYELSALVRKGLGAMLVLGALAGAAMFVLTPWLATDVLRVSKDLQPESIAALQILAACLPFVTVTAGLRGILEAKSAFVWVNAIRIPQGLLTFLAPMAVAAFTPALAPLAAALGLLRVAAALAHLVLCMQFYPELFAKAHGVKTGVRKLLTFGAWLTVSNIVGPLMVYSDRFVLGATVGLSAVAYYSAPYEVITRLWLIPTALTAVIFPALSAQLVAEPARALSIYRWSIKFVFLSIYPCTLVLAFLAPDWLGVWLGAEYANQSAGVATLLALGVLVNCLANVPFTLLQSAGRADLTAKLHVAELPAYFALLLWLAGSMGIGGAALAWSLRCAVDAFVLFLLARRYLPKPAPVLSGAQLASVGVLVLLNAAAAVPILAPLRWTLLLVCALLFGVLSWFVLLSPAERQLVRHPWLMKDALSRS